jgi:hypothetical protein
MTPPSGWIETGTTLSFSGSLLIQIAAVRTDFAIEPIVVEAGSEDIFIGLESSGNVIACGDWGSRDSVSLYTRKFSEAFGARTIEATVAGSCPQPFLSVAATRVISGLRLIVTVDVDTADNSSRLRYRLWADELTVDTITVGGKSVVLDHSAGVLGLTPSIQVRHEAIPFLGPAPPGLANGIVLAGATWDGVADPVTFDNEVLRGYNFFSGVGGTIWAYSTTPPLHFEADVAVTDAAGATPPGQVRVGTYGEFDLLANPAVLPITRWRWTTTSVFGRLYGDWSADGVALPTDDGTTDTVTGDEIVPLRQIKPKSPENAPEAWEPAEYEVTSPLSILLSGNVFTGTGAVVVSGGTGQTWTVSGAGASVSRTLAEQWRNWNDPIDPNFEPTDLYRTTKHDYYASGGGDDIWGWGLFAYLEVDLTAPANGDLTLTITWVAAGASPVQADKTYVVPVLTGTATYRVDLLFPAEGGPWYAERVDAIQFEGFQNGVYTLNDLRLLAVEPAYVKLHARGSYSGLTISQDGSFAVGHWGDNPLIGAGPARQKDDESGYFDFTGTPDTSAGGAVRMDGTLEDVVDEWHRMEGITATYDGTQIDADLTDGVNVIGTEDELSAVPLTYTARWYHTQMSLRSAPNATTGLDASLYLDGGADLCPAPAGTFVLPFRHTLGMVLEAQCKDSVTSQRAGAGAPVFARRSTTGAPTSSDPLLAEGVTDASGFASVAVRVGTVSGSEIYVALLDE